VSILNVSERFIVPAPPEVVWGHLTEPASVVTCLPGATLDESSEDGRSHKGSITVKLGAFSVSYRGEAEFVTVDDEARRLEIKGKGREKTGAGAVSMTMESTVEAAPGGSEVRVDATIQLAGKIVSFGRGMVDAVAGEVLDAFATCLARKLGEDGSGSGSAGPRDTAGTEGASGATEEGGPSRSGEARDTVGTPGVSGAEPSADLGFGLLFRAFRSWLRRLFGGGR
jgi:carbon monoxide dehydrogenase subunit G